MSRNAQEVMRRLARFETAATQGTTAALATEMPRLASATQGRMARATGDLADSVSVIRPEVNGSTVTAGVKVGSPHGAAQEFGTSTVRPHPSFRPSIRESQARTPGEIAQSIRNTFK